jgi:hypothetical protein
VFAGRQSHICRKHFPYRWQKIIRQLGEITSQYDVPQIDRIDQVCESDAEVSTRFLQNLQNDPVTATCSIRNTGNELQIPAELEQSSRQGAL